jgi:hypothetical protein
MEAIRSSETSNCFQLTLLRYNTVDRTLQIYTTIFYIIDNSQYEIHYYPRDWYKIIRACKIDNCLIRQVCVRAVFYF